VKIGKPTIAISEINVIIDDTISPVVPNLRFYMLNKVEMHIVRNDVSIDLRTELKNILD
jgi:hypothetical protein